MSEPSKRDAPPDTDADARPVKRAHAEEDNEPTGIEPYLERVRTAIRDFDLVEYVEKFCPVGTAAVVKLVDEYLRFMTIKLYLAEMCPAVKISPSAMVDNVWHVHILQTAEYRRFCTSLGVQIDHSPLDAFDREQHAKRLEACKVKYVEHFNADPPREIWEENAAFPSPEEDVYVSDKIEITVFTMTGKRMTFDVPATSTVSDFKKLVRARDSPDPESKIMLLYKGQEMEDDKALEYYTTHKEHAKVHMLHSLRGC